MSAVLTQKQSGMIVEFRRLRGAVIEASRSAKEVYRQVSNIEGYVNALYSQPPQRVAQLMPQFMDAMQVMTTSSAHFCQVCTVVFYTTRP